MQISTEILAVLTGSAFTGISAVVGWIFTNVIRLSKDTVKLETRLESTDTQVEDIKETIKDLTTTLSKHSSEQKDFMIQILETISSMNTSIARLDAKIETMIEKD